MHRSAIAASRAMAIAAAICALASVHVAGAQSRPSLDARTWRASADAQASLVLEPTTTQGPWVWSVGAWTSYAENPVKLLNANGGTLARPLAHQLSEDLVAAIGLGSRAALGLDVPLFAWQSSVPEPLPAGLVDGSAVPTSGLGDVSLFGKTTLVSNDRQGLRAGWGLASTSTVSFPTGDRRSFMGEGSVTASIRLLAEYALSVASVRASLGWRLRTRSHTWPGTGSGEPRFGDEIPWAFGLTLRPKVLANLLDNGDRQLWELAVHGALPAGPTVPFGLGAPGASDLSPVLLAIDDRIALGHDQDAYVLMGGEIGLTEAIGVPVACAVLSIGWQHRNHDRDEDGIPDDVDQCPDLPEDRDGIQDQDGCPEDDADSDGILDEEDACPLVAGVPSSDPKSNGCPPPTQRAAPKPQGGSP